MANSKGYEPACEKSGYRGLANAIVLYAVRDYRDVLIKLHKKPKDYYAQDRMNELKRFFHSQWFHNLCEVDPDWLMEMLEIQLRKNGYKIKEIRL